MRYSDNSMAGKYSDAPDYVENNIGSVIEMHRQVGDLVLDDKDIAIKGLLIRLLAIPGGVSGTINTLRTIRDRVSKNVYLSIMSQYYPTFKAYGYRELSCGIGSDEYANIVDEAHLLGLNKGWTQETPKNPDRKFFGTDINPDTRSL
jgi:putative pyruvate formate lyase activating enzyme